MTGINEWYDDPAPPRVDPLKRFAEAQPHEIALQEMFWILKEMAIRIMDLERKSDETEQA